MNMTETEKILWNKIASFKFDDDDSSFTFTQRLSRENGWTISYTQNVIEEYRKFLFLCCISKNGVTPSDQVDQAWHLHLTYTKSYWTALCKNVLEKEIHHNPTKGGKAEGEKFDDYYTGTLQLYKEKFGTIPPGSIWPGNNKRFSDINFQRVNLKEHWLIRRPVFKRANLILVFVIAVALFCIQAQSNTIGWVVGIAIVIGIFIYTMFKGGGNSKNGGCSTSGCGHSGCGHSGCSGCGGSGCGGGGD